MQNSQVQYATRNLSELVSRIPWSYGTRQFEYAVKRTARKVWGYWLKRVAGALFLLELTYLSSLDFSNNRWYDGLPVIAGLLLFLVSCLILRRVSIARATEQAKQRRQHWKSEVVFNFEGLKSRGLNNIFRPEVAVICRNYDSVKVALEGRPDLLFFLGEVKQLCDDIVLEAEANLGRS